jgi:putative copper export protein
MSTVVFWLGLIAAVVICGFACTRKGRESRRNLAIMAVLVFLLGIAMASHYSERDGKANRPPIPSGHPE